jgi:hypothetical protein
MILWKASNRFVKRLKPSYWYFIQYIKYLLETDGGAKSPIYRNNFIQTKAHNWCRWRIGWTPKYNVKSCRFKFNTHSTQTMGKRQTELSQHVQSDAKSIWNQKVLISVNKLVNILYYLLKQSRAWVNTCDAKSCSCWSIYTCSNVTLIDVLSLALLQLVILMPWILRQIWKDKEILH